MTSLSDPGDARRATGESGHGRCAVSTDPATPLAAPVPQPTGTTHQRIQLRRTKGWRKPEGAIVVARPSKWGNPYTVLGAREAGLVGDWWPAGVDVDVDRVHQFDCDNLDCPTCTPIANANFVAAIESMR